MHCVCFSIESFNKENIRETLQAIFQANKYEGSLKSFQNLKQKLSMIHIKKSNNDQTYKILLSVLNELSEDETFLDGFCSNKNEATSLLKLLAMSCCGQEDRDFKIFIGKLRGSTIKSAHIEHLVIQLCTRYGITDPSRTREKNVVSLLDDFVNKHKQAENITDATNKLIAQIRGHNIESLPKENLIKG